MTLYEYYNTGDDTSEPIYNSRWASQTFTVGTVGTNENHNISKIKLKLRRQGFPGTITVSIRATDANGKPTGSDLSTGTIDGNTLTTNSDGAWYEIEMSEYTLQASTKYAIVVRAPSGHFFERLFWRADSSSPSYNGGCAYSSADSGQSWEAKDTWDFMFEEYGTSGGQNLTQDLSDTLTLSESLKHDVGVKLTETLNLAEALRTDEEAKLTDTLSLAESISVKPGVVLSETLNLSESISSALGLQQALSDTLTLNEDLKHDIGVKLTDTLALAESIASEIGIVLSETLNLSESTAMEIGVKLTEALNLAESIAEVLGINIPLSDTLNLSESISTASEFYVDLTETLNLSEKLAADIQMYLQDTLGLSESVSAELTKAIIEKIRKKYIPGLKPTRIVKVGRIGV